LTETLYLVMDFYLLSKSIAILGRFFVIKLTCQILRISSVKHQINTLSLVGASQTMGLAINLTVCSYEYVPGYFLTQQTMPCLKQKVPF
jgi:hypothetical protein